MPSGLGHDVAPVLFLLLGSLVHWHSTPAGCWQACLWAAHAGAIDFGGCSCQPASRSHRGGQAVHWLFCLGTTPSSPCQVREPAGLGAVVVALWCFGLHRPSEPPVAGSCIPCERQGPSVSYGLAR